MLISPDWPAPTHVHAYISTRQGGASLPPYDTNNFGLHVGDDPHLVELNRQALKDQLGLNPQWLHQIHGTKVVAAKPTDLVLTADGSYTSRKDVACAIMTADCLPIFLCDQRGTRVALIHCGWRGLAKGICFRAVKKFDCPSGELMAYLGPAISQAWFEVGIEVVEAFFKSARNEQHREAIATAFVSGARPLHFYADIYALARAELQALGVLAVYSGNYCTYTQKELFYSYRRDGTTGRMASLIWLS